MNMSDPHVDDKNTDRYDNTYNRSCDVNMFGPHVQGRVGMRKNVCTQRLVWLRDPMSISLMRKRAVPKSQFRLLEY